MKLILQATKEEKRILLILAVILSLFAYWFNKKYVNVIEAEFENSKPVSIIVKVGFILPVEKFIEMKDGISGKIKFYGYKYSVKKTINGFDLSLNSKKVYSIYSDEYYLETKKLPTGRISL